jgi:hypothetical protein
MNDWNNDNFAPGDLVHVYNRPVSPQTGIVLSLNKPPVGSLQIYDAQVLIEGRVVNVYRHDMYRITDDGIANVAYRTQPTALSPQHSQINAHSHKILE